MLERSIDKIVIASESCLRIARKSYKDENTLKIIKRGISLRYYVHYSERVIIYANCLMKKIDASVEERSLPSLNLSTFLFTSTTSSEPQRLLHRV